MGTVWRARRADGTLAAIKTVREASAGLANALQREIEALAALDHPGIVRVLDHGVHDGLPWMAMELAPGRPLRQRRHAAETIGEVADPATWWTTALDTPREPIRETGPGAGMDPVAAMRIIRRLCGPIGWLHGEGIVHRDLKPDNVMLSDDDWPLVVDFGVLARSGTGTAREGIGLVARAAGTLAYMAPEQIAGRIVDARADLFSLGCILYEMLAGQPPGLPRRGDDARLRRPPPVPIASLRDDVDPRIDELIGRLLHENPSRRLACAESLADALVRLGATDEPLPGPRPRPHLYRTQFAGREAPLRRLRERLAALRDGAGGVVLIGGNSGVGKTRLLVEIAQEEAPELGIRVLTGECLEGRSRPLEGLLRPIQDVVERMRDRDPERAERLLAPFGSALVGFVPEIAPGAVPAAMSGDPVAAVVGAARAVLLADKKPTVLILDDVQWADELVRAFIAQAADQPELLVLAAHRLEEPTPELETLQSRPGIESITLGPLDAGELASLAADMLALPSPPVPLGAHLARASDGNAFVAAEIVRAAVAEGLVTRDASGSWRGIDSTDGLAALPADPEALVARRVETLSDLARQRIELAAVVGRVLPMSLLGDGATLGELLRAQMLEPVGDDEVRFAHDRLREGVLRRLTADRRRVLCASAAQAIGDGSRWQSALGSLFEGAGDLDAARQAWVEAATRSESASYARAESELAAALRCAPDPGPERWRIATRRAGLLVRLADGERARPLIDELLAQTRAAGDTPAEIAVEMVLCDLEQQSAHFTAARDRAADLLLRAQRADLPDLELEARHMWLSTRNMLADWADHERETQSAIELAERLGNPRFRHALRAHLASFFETQGRFREARQVLLELDAFPGMPARQRILVGHNLADLETLLGEFDVAIPRLSRVWELSGALGTGWMHGYCAANLGMALRGAGRHAAALEWLLRAHRVAVATRDPRLLALAHAYRGRTLLDLGDWDAARVDIEQSVQHAERVGHPALSGGVLTNLGRLQRLTGDPSAALDTLYAARARFGESVSYYAALNEAEIVLTLGALGRPFDAELAAVTAAAARMGIRPESQLGSVLAEV